jgi:LL-diaminopimelate aminotransferase
MHITTANRLEGISEYYFAGKLREIAELRAKGQDIINLGIGSPDLPPHPTVLEALQHSASKTTSHGYQSYTGTPALREAWAGWYAQYYKAQLRPTNEVLPLIGSKEGIVHLAMTFLQAGDVALVPNPGYPTYRAASMLAGAEVRHYDLNADNGWQPDWETLEQQDLQNVKIMWANYPHMPTGAQATVALFERLVAFGKKHNILIVNDNPYSFILNDQPKSILAVDGAKEVAVELNSLSKSHNMAGWRVGALLGSAEHLGAVLRFKSNMDSGQFLPTQEAAIAALQLGNAWYEALNATYRERQKLAFEILDALGCTFDPLQQGMFVWARIPAHWQDGYALSDHALYNTQVFLTPGGIFGSVGAPYVRISLCQDVSLFKTALQRIQAYETATV